MEEEKPNTVQHDLRNGKVGFGLLWQITQLPGKFLDPGNLFADL
jgi:hypothetical protein